MFNPLKRTAGWEHSMYAERVFCCLIANVANTSSASFENDPFYVCCAF